MKKHAVESARKARLSMLALAAGMAVSFAAWALPYPADGYVTVATYYSSAAKTQIIGVRGYENCPPNSAPIRDWGETSLHVTVEIIRCAPRWEDF